MRAVLNFLKNEPLLIGAVVNLLAVAAHRYLDPNLIEEVAQATVSLAMMFVRSKVDGPVTAREKSDQIRVLSRILQLEEER